MNVLSAPTEVYVHCVTTGEQGGVLTEVRTIVMLSEFLRNSASTGLLSGVSCRTAFSDGPASVKVFLHISSVSVDAA